MAQTRSDSLKTAALLFLVVLIAPFIVNCFFAYPQTDDFMFSVASRDSGFLKAQYDTYINWSGRFTSTALLSINPLVYGSLTGYRTVFAVVIAAQIASLYLLAGALTRDVLSRRERVLIALALFFAFLDQMNDVRSGLYWMAGVVTYGVAQAMMALWLSLVLLLHQDRHRNTTHLQGGVLLLSLLLGGTNEIALVLTVFGATLFLWFRYRATGRVGLFHVGTLVAALTGGSLAALAPGNFARMSGQYHVQRDLAVVAWDALQASLASMAVWVTTPLALMLMAAVFFAVTGRPRLRAALSGVTVPSALLILFLVMFTSFLVPYWATGSYPQNRVLNMIYFCFLAGWLILVAIIAAGAGEAVVGSIRNVCSRRWGLLTAGLAALFSIQSSNAVMVSRDLASGLSYRYSKEMEQKQSQLTQDPCDVCTVRDVVNRPASLYFTFQIGRAHV